MAPPPLDRDVWRRRQQACFVLANAFDLSKAHRLEIASVILDRHIESWNDLDHVEMGRLLDALQGASLVAHIHIERRRGQRI